MSKLRRRILRIAVGVIAGFGIPVAAVGIYIAQPMLTSAPADYRPAVEPARLEAHVRMLSETFRPRDARHPDNLERTAAYVEDELRRAGARIRSQDVVVPGQVYRNVIGEFGPASGPRIVVGAHYDAYLDLPGADDNASGVAGLVELAWLLGRDPPPVRVELVAWTLEEPPWFATPHMGSAVHAKSLVESKADVVLAISLEMIGYFTDELWTQESPMRLLHLYYPFRGNFIAVVGRIDQRGPVGIVKRAMAEATPLPVRSINAPPNLQGVDFSDHRNYWRYDYPAVMITDTAFMRNRAYHRESDTADRLDYRRMAMVVEGVFAAIRAMGEQAKR